MTTLRLHPFPNCPRASSEAAGELRRCTVCGPIRPGLTRPAAFTLLEMLLVLAILVVLPAVTLPVVGRMYDTHRIQQAAMEVRTALSAARLRAVDRGEPIQCRIEPQGRQLIVVGGVNPGIRFGDTGEERAPEVRETAAAIHIELPEPLYFWTADPVRETLPPTADWPLDRALQQVDWSPAIVFTPNGKATETRFEIRDLQGRRVQLFVRGLTGAASSSRLLTGRDR